VYQNVEKENGKMMKLTLVNLVMLIVKNVSDQMLINVTNVMKTLSYKITDVSLHHVNLTIIQILKNGNVNLVMLLVLNVHVVKIVAVLNVTVMSLEDIYI